MKIIDIYNMLENNAIDVSFKFFVDVIVKKFLNNDDLIFVEVGALHANDSLYFKNKYPNSNVHAIEGLPENYERFMKNLTNINTYNTCIASYNGTIIYHQKNELLSGIHGIYNRGNLYGTKTLNLNCITFETFCKNNNIDKIDVIKIDVEGATYDVLKSIENNILHKIKIMHIETENYPFFEGQQLDDQCEKILINNNFKCICKTGYYPTLRGMQFDSVWINLLYLTI